MKYLSILLAVFLQLTCCSAAQAQDDFSVELVPVAIEGMPGLQSYALAQHEGMWLLVGGRTEGIHARQGHSSFPAANNNTKMYVVDIKTGNIWSQSVDSLPVALSEQLQSTNMQHYQEGEKLVLIGGYAFSNSKNKHITHPHLSVIDVPSVIDAIIGGRSVLEHIVQIEDEAFALTGGQLGKIGDVFFLVGGHRFDGRYNPHGPDHGMGFKQEYSNEIRRFRLLGSGGSTTVEHLPAFRDETHLRRRDFNLLPQRYADGSEGLALASGVFQKEADLPFLYPVEIRSDGYTPVEQFSQRLSNYHSAKVSLYSRSDEVMHHVFFGGISQHYFDSGKLVKDDQVPFVKTISRLSRDGSGNWVEVALPAEMPHYSGAGAEFIPLEAGSRVLDLDGIGRDGTVIGHIYGGITSPVKHAFFKYETATTRADATVYEVRLVASAPSRNIAVGTPAN